MSSSKRLAKELADLTKEPLDGISVEASEENLYKWNARIQGPSSTPYQGGTFEVAIDFPIEYPFKGPKLRFLTPVYHPNVDKDGNMCVGVIKAEAWKPSTKASTILLAVSQLLAEPNPDDALVTELADEYTNRRAEFEKHAKEHTQKHAKK
ncbi:putative UBC5-E2 ubiquitin-conjugating enzyme [Acaromyces ingoldii]|uniref:E2 ubiquitin-conjugating enzyme n=1 Tax=Acaromyces ingoldii TaxID=215250 RepID=A0A316YRE6_9BASI|nr:putative UBC5-E2 ubiquitin-conjugating enzyme [Acaromyces ingoldii]PWN91811.1 putative UBC5-E2 ubiquitin-conjugating enzyme [Acaromyces ingoldii]